MKGFVITLKDHSYSEQSANRCIESGKKHGIAVEKWHGIDKHNAEQKLNEEKLEWTWANNNTSKRKCPHTGLIQTPYTTNDLRNRIGCFMSHFYLWKHCVELNEPILILEHDAVFIRQFPENIDFKGICQINDPIGCTPKGHIWSAFMKNRGTTGVHIKTPIRTGAEEHVIPDGLAGNSAYLIKPWAAQEVINKCYEVGVWPNDAIMNRTLFPYLEEYYPFITKINQTQSTTSD